MIVRIAVKGGIGDHDGPVAFVLKRGVIAQAYRRHEPAAERHGELDGRQVRVLLERLVQCASQRQKVEVAYDADKITLFG